MRRPKREPMWRRYLRFFGANVEADVDDELRDHIARLECELRERGVPADEIADAVRARFGDAEAIRARLTRADGSRHRRDLRLEAFGNLRQEAAYALRRLRQRPGFTAAVVIVLALGVGATTAMFSAVDAAMLRPLPFPRPDRLVFVNSVGLPYAYSDRYPPPAFQTPNLNDIAAMSGTFTHVAEYEGGGMNLGEAGHPIRVQAGQVTPDFFATMGVAPLLGRGFTGHEGKPNGPAVVVLSNALWRNSFGGRPMLDSVVILTGKPYTVVGIMPRGFNFPRESDLWIPLSNPMTGDDDGVRGNITMQVVARMNDGVSYATAYARVVDLWRRFAATAAPGDSGGRRQFSQTLDEVGKMGFLQPMRAGLVGNQRVPLVLLLGATAVLLLIACANVANLLLARSAERRREIAMRALLGATRVRIVRQLLVESVMLALGGTVAGLVVAPAGLRLARQLMPASLAGVVSPTIDLRVLAFTALLALLTGVGFGLWPALDAARPDLGEAVKGAGGHGSTATGGRARRVLLGAEVALTVALVVGAGLLLRSFARLTGVESGLEPSHVVTAQLSFDRDVSTAARRLAELEPILARLRTAPGVEAAGAVSELPISEFGGTAFAFHGVGQAVTRGQFAQLLAASPGYFAAMGITLLDGRSFTLADDSLAPPVAIVDRTLADSVWPHEHAAGRRIVWGRDTITVVGVVSTVRQLGLTQKPLLQIYRPVAQQMVFRSGGFGGIIDNLAVVVRGPLPERALEARIRDAVRSTSATQALYDARPMAAVIDESIAPRRTNALLLSMLGGLALVLASLGTYAVVACAVTQRRRELGIRAALGATGRDLLALVSREVLGAGLGGLVIGFAVAWIGARLLGSLLYGVTVHDLTTFVLAPIALVVPAAIATLIPARRAAHTNPVDVIREE